MDIASEPRPGLPIGSANPAASISPAGAYSGVQLDWHGLVARLEAAHGLHEELGLRDAMEAPADPVRKAGSFAPHAAKTLARYARPSFAAARNTDACGQPYDESFYAVNLTTLADSKTVSGISRVVAGLNAPGTEG